MSAFVFIESNTTGTGELFIKKAMQRGLTPYFLTANRSKYPFLASLPVIVVALDTSNLEQLCRFCAALGELSGVFSSSEYFIEMAHQVAARLQLPTANTEAVRICRDKARLARVLEQAGVRVPASIALNLLDLSAAALERLPYPAVIKPNSGSGSVDVRRVADADEAARHCERIRKAGHAVALAQQYVPGEEYSVETLTLHGQTRIIGVVKKYLGAEPEFVEIGHSYPAMLPTDARHALERATLRALTAVDFRFGPAHTEVRLHQGQVTIVEINPRLAGGMIPLLLDAVFDSDILGHVLDAWTGKAAFEDFVSKRYAAIRFAMVRAEGVLASPLQLPQSARSHPALKLFYAMKQPGDHLRLQGDFRDRVAAVICAGEQREEIERLAAAVAADVEPQLLPVSAAAAVAGGFGLSPALEAILYHATPAVDSAVTELSYLFDLNEAHLIMLGETGLVSRERIKQQLRCHATLRAGGFAALLNRPRPRGLYIMLEQFLIETLGESVGGILQLGRSRNDMNATITRLKLRVVHMRVFAGLAKLRRTLLFKASASLAQAFPIYSQYQPALPGTFAHQLLSFEQALAAEHQALLLLLAEINVCPMGAGAGGGTTLAIDSGLVCKLLGFERPAANSLDAVASRSSVLRFLAGTNCLAVLLSRLAQDLQMWTLMEAALARLPDALCGASSMLPQKRNPFLIEYLKTRAAVPLGCLTSATQMVSKVPYTNSFESGSQLNHLLAEAAQAMSDMLSIADTLIDAIDVDASRTAEQLQAGAVAATAVTEKMVVRESISFRTAHAAVGQMIRVKRESGESAHAALLELDASLMSSSPLDWALSHRFGGGPGSIQDPWQLVPACKALAEDCRVQHHAQASWQEASEMRRAIVVQMLAS